MKLVRDQFRGYGRRDFRIPAMAALVLPSGNPVIADKNARI